MKKLIIAGFLLTFSLTTLANDKASCYLYSARAVIVEASLTQELSGEKLSVKELKMVKKDAYKECLNGDVNVDSLGQI